MPELAASTKQNTAQSVAAGNRPSPVEERPGQDLFLECLERLPIRRKLVIGAVDNPLEAEADAVADRVMRMPEPAFIQRKCAKCEEMEGGKLRRKPLAPFLQRQLGEAALHGESRSIEGIESSRGNGNPLDRPARRFMESRFGADFSDVRVHADDASSRWTTALNAQAFTAGRDIYFNSGQ